MDGDTPFPLKKTNESKQTNTVGCVCVPAHRDPEAAKGVSEMERQGLPALCDYCEVG